MPTEMELTLEQTQQGVSYEVSMEILLEPTSNKLMVDNENMLECTMISDTYVLERFNTSAGNPVKDIILILNLPYHMSFLEFEGYLI
ncbi:hypothetical protein Tco_1111151 [Tanacetum coccineum]|uniref:Uncharacterized protein n=1 Tax=Tanacetum coccineum TaxID=301880 RepID=A0ABQ5IMX2_9ASTR